jgi:hypothetical protein
MTEPFKEGERVRYASDYMPGYLGREGVVVSAGRKTARIRFGYETINCSAERLERLA